MLLSVSHVTKKYGEQTVLNDVSFSVAKGTVFALCGPSGSGKTTLVKIISGLCPFDAGCLRIAETSITADQQYPRSHYGKVGVVFQEHNLFPHLTALENVALALRHVRRQSSEAARKRALEELSNVGLADKSKQHPVTLSGGERQRIAIARALALDPHLLLLDEPTSSLDSHRTGEVLKTIHGLAQRGATMLLVTHDLQFARRTAGQFGVLTGGACTVSSCADVLDALDSDYPLA